MTNFFINLIHNLAPYCDDSFGLTVILVTLGVRILLMPLFYKTYKQSSEMQKKMAVIKPETEKIQERIKKAQTAEEKENAQKELAELYQKNQMNPFSMGCLPLIIQMPIFIGLYNAIRNSKEIAAHSFLWFHLGEKDILLAILVLVISFVQINVMQYFTKKSNNNPINGQISTMVNYITPISMFLVSMSTPSALSLYLATGSVFMIIQSIIFYLLKSPSK